jgi:hypothetical protein
MPRKAWSDQATLRSGDPTPPQRPPDRVARSRVSASIIGSVLHVKPNELLGAMRGADPDGWITAWRAQIPIHELEGEIPHESDSRSADLR